MIGGTAISVAGDGDAEARVVGPPYPGTGRVCLHSMPSLSTLNPTFRRSHVLNLLPLHMLAAGRGDGLHPRLLELLELRARSAAAPTIAALALHRGDPHMQAGPHPAGDADQLELPDNVVRFAARPVKPRLSSRSKAVS